ncbi:hypothetical protein PR202_gb15287 [Eleusine coracana subsp. coracana]|uniref:Uncharacterized protein n=1 Tax=Eleusine coracana subsp. coracana TaxID=191504 RepID=A0AAV5EXV2_ELECO|nr:hypothetical protein PR202_gb15287 [Eleusine coracana subsp. coracana]
MKPPYFGFPFVRLLLRAFAGALIPAIFAARPIGKTSGWLRVGTDAPARTEPRDRAASAVAALGATAYCGNSTLAIRRLAYPPYCHALMPASSIHHFAASMGSNLIPSSRPPRFVDFSGDGSAKRTHRNDFKDYAEAGARHGSRANAALGIQQGSLTLLFKKENQSIPSLTLVSSFLTFQIKSNYDAVRRALDFMLEWLYFYPQGFRELLLYIKEKYDNPTIYITENGIDEVNNNSLPLQEALKDDTRMEYSLSAIRDGANVKGYFAWSLDRQLRVDKRLYSSIRDKLRGLQQRVEALLITTSLCQTSQVSDRDLAALIKVREHFGNPNLFPGWRLGTTCISWWPAACNEQGRVTKLFLDNLLGIKETSKCQHHAPAGHQRTRDARDAEHYEHSRPARPHPRILRQPPAPLPLQHHRHQCLRLDTGVPLPHQSHLRQLIQEQAHRPDPEVAAEAAVPFLLRRLVQRPHRDHSAGGLVRSTPDSPAALQLDGNRLSGTIPRSYRFERNSMEFRVANNRLTGDASFLFGRHKTVSGTIDLSGNNFRFNLTGVEMPMHLGFLNLSHNRIYGGVPVSLRESRVSVLDLSYNELCGEIPTGGHMVQFKAAAYEHNKCLCGTPLPPCANGR